MQDKIFRYYINANNLCSAMITRAELGKFPIEFKVHTSMVKYFLRLSQGTGNKLVNDAFKCAKETDSQWVQTITRLLKINGFSNVLHSPLVVNRNIFPKVFLKRLQDIYLQQLRYSDFSKVNYYMESCHEGIGYTFQNYIEKVRNPNYRKVLAKLRSGTNWLFLEKGRYENIPPQDKVCPLCENEVENNEHFLFRCSKLQLERDKWLGNLYQQIKDLKNKPSNYQCRKVLTLNFENENVCKMVAKGISNMYTVREKLEAARLKETSN